MGGVSLRRRPSSPTARLFPLAGIEHWDAKRPRYAYPDRRRNPSVCQQRSSPPPSCTRMTWRSSVLLRARHRHRTECLRPRPRVRAAWHRSVCRHRLTRWTYEGNEWNSYRGALPLGLRSARWPLRCSRRAHLGASPRTTSSDADVPTYPEASDYILRRRECRSANGKGLARCSSRCDR